MPSTQRERACTGGCPIGSLASELADLDETSRLTLAQGYAAWEDRDGAALAAMRDRGELRSEADTGQLALALLVALQGGLLMTQAHRDTGPLEAALDTVLDRIESFRS